MKRASIWHNADTESYCFLTVKVTTKRHRIINMDREYAMKQWPNQESKPRTEYQDTVPTPETCPYCDESIKDLPAHLRNNCEEC